MAGNVQSNIHINVTSNANQTFNDIRQSSRSLFDSLAQDVNNINKTFDDIRVSSQDLFDSLSEPVGFNNTVESMEGLGESTDEMNININSLVNSLLQMASTGNMSSASMLAFGKSLGVPALAITALTTAIKLGIDQVEDFIDDMKKLGEVLGDGTSFAIDGIVDSLGLLVDGLKEASEAMVEFSEHGIKIQGDYYSMFNFLEDDAVKAIHEYANALKELYNINPNTYISNMEGILSVAHNIAQTTQEQVEVVTALNNTAYDLFAKTGGAYGNVNQIKSQLENAINLNVLNSRSAIAKALDLTDAMVKEFKELGDATERYNWILEKTTGIQGLYTKWLQTESGQIELLKQNYQLLLDNIGQLALGLYAKIAPILNMLLDLANEVLGKITAFFGIDLKNSAMQNSADAYSNIADSIEEIGESAEASRRKVSKFDDVIQINDSGKLDNSLASKFGEMTFSNDWLNNIDEGKSKIKELAEQLEELFGQGRYYEAGRLLADTLKGWLIDIPWDEIRKEAEWLGIDIANFLNGLLADSELFSEIGNLFAQGINTAFQFLLGFGRNFDFTQLGTDIGTAWESFWTNLDSKVISESVYEWFMGGFETLNGMIEAGSISTATGKIADIIIDLFSNITEEDITLMADTLIGTIDEVFDAVATFMDKMEEHPEIKEKILLFIEKLFTGFKENSGEWGETLGETIIELLDLASEMLETADQSGLSEGIRNFLDRLNLGEIFKTWFNLKLDAWIIEQKATLPAKLSLLGDAIVNVFAVLCGLILGLVTGIIVKILEKFGELILYVSELGSNIGEQMRQNVSDWISTVQNINDALPEIFEELGRKIGEKVVGIWDKISNILGFDKFKELGKDIISGILQGLSTALVNLKTWWNNNIAGELFKIPDWIPVVGGNSFKIPRLATGGIVSRSTLANIGEDGAEAVLPLEKNTGWMDSLATKLANKISVAKSTGGNIVLPLSDLNKAFYTRNEMVEFAEMVVEALKVYGVNVAVVG